MTKGLTHCIPTVADEVYQLLEFGETPSVGLFDLDDPKNPTVFAINSFSKILAPGLRLGWIETNVKHMQRILECGPLTSGGGFNPITSGMAYQLLKSGFISDHIDLLRGKYAETCSILCRSLDTHLRAALSPGEELKYRAPAGGFFCFVTLPERIDTNRLQDIALAKHGVTFFPGNVSSEKKDKFLNCLRLCFAFVDSEKIEQGVMRLADAIRGYV